MYGGIEPFQSDPHWRDLLLFYEYFHGDNGAGLGASHQTGWTGLVALLLAQRPGCWRPAEGGACRALRAPAIYEINTAVWLGDLSRQLGRRSSSPTSRAQEWDRLAAPRVDAVWLMGVWERSPAGLAIAQRRTRSSWRASAQALPDLRDDDVIGSPYCIRRYVRRRALRRPDGAGDRARRARRAAACG